MRCGKSVLPPNVSVRLAELSSSDQSMSSADRSSRRNSNGTPVASTPVGDMFFEGHAYADVLVGELVDAIVDITETGSSLRANNLRIVDTLMESYPQFVANPDAYANPEKREKMERIALLLKGALAARDVVGLKMNLEESRLAEILEKIPSLRKPTISPLAEDGWVAVETVIGEAVVREILPSLKELGAEGIIEYPLNKLIH